MRQPMLARPGKPRDLSRAGYLYEPKLDGTRAMCYKDSKLVFVNRRGRDITDRYPEFDFIHGIKAGTCIMDGEIVVFDSKGNPDFHLLQKREQSSPSMRKALTARHPATYVAFDVLMRTPIKTVLVIDDDPNFRAIVVQFLRVQGFPVLETSEGEEGIRLAKAHKPEVIVCDLLMPRCNGFHVCRTLRRDEFMRGTRIIVFSGRSYETDRQAAFSAGADEYLTKPVDPNTRMDVINRLTEQGSTREDPETTDQPAAGARWFRFWGVRGSIPTPWPETVRIGGNTSCVEVRTPDGDLLILDAGTGIRPLGLALQSRGDDRLIGHIFLSHTHWDHIQGLPFFTPARPAPRSSRPANN